MNDRKPYDIFDDLESLFWVLLVLALRIFNFGGNLQPQRFDEEEFPDDPDKSNVSNYKAAILNGVADFRFGCRQLDMVLHSLSDFHEEHNEKRRNAQRYQTQEAYEILSEYEADIEANLNMLLAHFDDVLQEPAVNWSNNAVDFDYPQPVTATRSRKGLFENRRKFILDGEWNNDPRTEGQEEEDEEERETPPVVAHGKGRARKVPLTKHKSGRQDKLNTIPEDIEEDRGRTTRPSSSEASNVRTLPVAGPSSQPAYWLRPRKT